MSDQPSMSNFFAFSAVLVGIVLFCVVAGGYTSFYRSQNRIEAAKLYVTQVCQKRMDLLPDLLEMTKKSAQGISTANITLAAKTANESLQDVTLAKTPLKESLLKDLELSQKNLTLGLKEVFTQLETSLDKVAFQEFKPLKEQFDVLQDNLFIAKGKYDNEVNYFNARLTSFPPMLFAKMFGFNKFKYINLSEDSFLPARESLAEKAS